MIRFTSEDGNPVVVAETKGYGIYLDNDSLSDLAKGDASRRQRFVGALHAKGTLLFSLANAIEVAGPQGASAGAVRAFLDSIGPHWIPLALNPWEVMRREQAGFTAEAAVSTKFMETYFQQRAYDQSQFSAVLDLSAEAFFCLGAVVDWAHDHRDQIRADSVRIDDALRARLEDLRADYERNPASLGRGDDPKKLRDLKAAVDAHRRSGVVRSFGIQPTISAVPPRRSVVGTTRP